jgi:transcriptional regulator with XRE-family HTH domain
MPSTKRWEEVTRDLANQPGDAERMANARARLATEEAAYFRHLADLRQARRMTQMALAKQLNMVQPSVSRLERQADLYVSTLRRYIEALGGRLEIHAVFPDLDYEIRFEDLETIDHDNPDLTEEHAPLPQALTTPPPDEAAQTASPVT